MVRKWRLMLYMFGLTAGMGIGLSAPSIYAQEGSTINILAWIGSGATPIDHPTTTSQVVYLTSEGEMEVLLELSTDVNRVLPCTERATSPDGRYFTFFVGGTTGTLYQVDGAGTPVAIDSGISAMTCVGMGTFRYSPDGSRFGYVDYVGDLTTSSYAAGWLYVYDSATRDIILSTDSEAAVGDQNVIAFDLSDHAVAFVNLYANATEAAIFYQAEGFPEEINTLYTENNCTFRSISISIIGDDRLALVVGQHCSGATEWALYTVSVSEHTANRTLVTGNVVGSYYPTARSNVMVVSPDEQTLYITYPDGLDQNSTNVQAVNLTDIQAGAPLFANALMPIYLPTNFYAQTLNARPVISPDGAWLAAVTKDANNRVVINVLELDAPDLPPITIAVPNANETVSAMAFMPDSSALLYVIGGNRAENNSLFSLDLVSVAETRIIRGRFGQGILVSPDGQSVALPNWRIVNAPNQPDYLTLLTLNLDTREPLSLFAGADVVDDVVSNLRFVYPLSWRGEPG